MQSTRQFYSHTLNDALAEWMVMVMILSRRMRQMIDRLVNVWSVESSRQVRGERIKGHKSR